MQRGRGGHRFKIAGASVAAVTFSALFICCVADDPTDTSGTAGADGGDASSSADGNNIIGDSGVDALVPPAQGFNIVLSPAHVTADPGDSNVPVAIQIVRASSFVDDVAFTIVPPAGVTASTAADTGNTGSSSSFTVSFSGTIALGDITLSVSGSNPSKSFVENATLGIHIGTRVDVSSGSYVVPSYATSLIVKAWGGGGGGGSGCAMCTSGSNPAAGGPGGAGGFATGTIKVTPGSSLVVLTGAGGGGGGTGGCAGWYGGGGGGGFTGLQVKSGSYLFIAGGGGGGAGLGVGGGAGGGSTGQDGLGTCIGYGGTQTAGGTSVDSGTCSLPGTAGTLGQGGNGLAYTCNDAGLGKGGAPGGGTGGIYTPGSGGGGGGYYGGGGGGGYLNLGGGGGGSAWSSAAGATLTAGNGATPNTGDLDYGKCAANSAVGGAAGASGGGVGGTGNPGCIVVYLTKP